MGDPLHRVPARVVVIEELRGGLVVVGRHAGTVLCEAPEREFEGFVIVVPYHTERVGGGRDLLFEFEKRVFEVDKVVVRHLRQMLVVAQCPERHFSRQCRGNALDGREYRGGQCLCGERPDALHQFFHTVVRQAQFVLLRRKFVGEARQDEPLRGAGEVDAFQGVDDLAVRTDQDDVAVLRHDLHGHRQGLLVAEFVGRREVEEQDAVEARLPDAGERGAAEALAQEHAEHGRCGRVLERRLRQVDAGAVGPGAEQQFERPQVPGAQRQHQFLRGGLVDFIHFCADDGGFQFLPDAVQEQSVKSHVPVLLSWAIYPM